MFAYMFYTKASLQIDQKCVKIKEQSGGKNKMVKNGKKW